VSRKSLTKLEIASALYERIGGFSRKESSDLVDLVFETVKETLGRGECVKVSTFGNFNLRDKANRRGRNPQTGESLVIAGRRVVSFRTSDTLRERMNQTPVDEITTRDS
jgi:integration host factor subunit alpha